ncbi:MAG: hypothetical protein ABJG41_16340 [Cyclobacteriaceae bacterium]
MKLYLISIIGLLFSFSVDSQNIDSLNLLAKQFVCRDLEKSDSISNIVIAKARETDNRQAEVDMLKNYLEIQQLRFNNSFEFAIEIDESIDPEEIQIPPLFAQPFVENAIEHGLKDKQAGGLISVRFKANQGDILLEVEDKGSGIENNSNKKNHKSWAKTITEDRLSIFSKRLSNQFSLQINLLKVGTLAKITLPSQSRA